MEKIHLVILIVLFLPFYFSFKKDKAVDSRAIQQIDITGSWGMCKRKSGDSFITGNICNTFNFKADGTGALFLGDLHGTLICNFKWKSDGTIIWFSFASKKEEESSIMNSKTEYSLLRYYTEDGEYLEITSNNGENVMYLARNRPE
ncbi:hypothetical protein [Flavobacterium subsaxonicum]|uniref:DUF306 domain-containing protein n=1 Tax=Flavobacterium subsaxonicum WB 4.1-42 = DSM 21790 TaxID=1121898 RepID=A0A0A2MNA7_9FLAO|nr:hypothetical protein [Flavobacterium subsaxonicum]KGO94137.1 hypothetical protein Q766_04185 [Flavobacterium subsaxonicum WB 4.1-42 = DSM 21790]